MPKTTPLKDALRSLGVYGNKHIPQVYLQASIEQRWALLKGLMDTDGTCEKRGQCEFTQKSKALMDGFIELVRSLGIKVSVHEKEAVCNGKKCGKVYRAFFYVSQETPCFRLKRKKERLKKSLAPRMGAKSIINIETIEEEPSKCIAVDEPDHLY